MKTLIKEREDLSLHSEIEDRITDRLALLQGFRYIEYPGFLFIYGCKQRFPFAILLIFLNNGGNTEIFIGTSSFLKITGD